MKKNFKWYKRGTGIRVEIPGDVDNFGKQKIRPGIVIKSYPSHAEVQLLSTHSSKNDYSSIIINKKTCYIRSVYYRTIPFNEIKKFWYENNKRVILDSKSTFFTKVAEMEYQEIIKEPLDLEEENNLDDEEYYDVEFEL